MYYYSGAIIKILFLVFLITFLLMFFININSNFVNYVFCISSGLLLGWLYNRKANLVIKASQTKKGEEYRQKYKKGETMKALINAIRVLIFEYDDEHKHKSFVLNITRDNDLVIQLLHRAHFPELCESSIDVNFGIAVYIPVDYMDNSMKEALEKILLEDAQELKQDSNPNTYYVIDVGFRLMYASSFLSRILKEVFDANDNNLCYELYDDLDLPYDKKLRPKFKDLS